MYIVGECRQANLCEWLWCAYVVLFCFTPTLYLLSSSFPNLSLSYSWVDSRISPTHLAFRLKKRRDALTLTSITPAFLKPFASWSIPTVQYTHVWMHGTKEEEVRHTRAELQLTNKHKTWLLLLCDLSLHLKDFGPGNNSVWDCINEAMHGTENKRKK